MLFPFTRIAVDCIAEKNGKILLIKRRIPPFIGKFAFPGGHLKYGESVEDCVVRETFEETGIKVEPKEILGVYSKKDRDPRGHVVSVTFICRPKTTNIKRSFESKALWVSIGEVEKLDFAFDHRKILEDYLKWKKKGGTYWSGKDD
jgi:8-oxo-dGTP diphosphatase